MPQDPDRFTALCAMMEKNLGRSLTDDERRKLSLTMPLVNRPVEIDRRKAPPLDSEAAKAGE